MRFTQAEDYARYAREGLAERLRALRLARGLTQEVLAERAQINWLEISRYERGAVKNPSMDRLCRLAFALEINLSALIPDVLDIQG